MHRRTQRALTAIAAATIATLGLSGTAGAAPAAKPAPAPTRLPSTSVAPGASTVPTSLQATTGPYQLGFSGALIYALINPNAQPQGVNDYSCRPRAGTQPVILVHGTYANQYDSFARMAPELKAAGNCVYSFNYGTDGTAAVTLIPGRYGTTGLSRNADELAAFAASVRQRTGATDLDFVGWSQGGTLINDYAKDVGGQGIDDAVTFGATHHGTTLVGLALLARAVGATDLTRDALGQAAVDQIRDSDYQRQLNADGDTVPGVDYTVVGTRYDEVTTPYRSTFLTAGPGATVRNITLQDGCGIDFSDHLSMMYSPRAIDIAKRALHPTGAGSLRCLPNAPVI